MPRFCRIAQNRTLYILTFSWEHPFVQQNMPRIATFGSLRDEDKDDSSNEYFSGGKESGVAVQGGSGRGGPSAEDLFSQLRNSDAANANPIPDEDSSEVKSITLTIWQGSVFSVDDGETEIVPRDPNSDPVARQIMSELINGRVPAEFRQRYGDKVDVNVENRNTDKFEVKKRPLKAFSGGGRRLGDVVPQIQGAGVVSSLASSAGPAPVEENKPAEVKVDESQPITKVQVRLGDGTRLVARFNPTQTVSDLREFVARASPVQREFVLMTTFPKKVLEDDNQTLEDAKLCNAAVIQRYT